MTDSDTNVLLSMTPAFADKLPDGTKTYEFRRRMFHDPSAADIVVIYTSAPVRGNGHIVFEGA